MLINRPLVGKETTVVARKRASAWEREREGAARVTWLTWCLPFPNGLLDIKAVFLYLSIFLLSTFRFTFPCYSLFFVQLAGDAFVSFPPSPLNRLVVHRCLDASIRSHYAFSLTSESESHCAKGYGKSQ